MRRHFLQFLVALACSAAPALAADAVKVFVTPVTKAMEPQNDYANLIRIETKSGSEPAPNQRVNVRVLRGDMLLYHWNGDPNAKAGETKAAAAKAPDAKQAPSAAPKPDNAAPAGDATTRNDGDAQSQKTNPEEYLRELPVTTDAQGKAAVSVRTLKEAGGEIEVALLDEGGKTLQSITRTIPAALYEGDFFSKRITTEVFGGVTMTNDYATTGENKGFQKSSPLVRLTFDDIWPSGTRRGDRAYHGLVHTGVDLEFSSFPFGPSGTEQASPQSRSPRTAAEPEATKSTTKGLENTFSGSLFILWQPDRWFASYSPSSTRKNLPYDAFRWGLFAKAGSTMRASVAKDGRTSIQRIQFGIKFTHHQTTVSKACDEQVNITPTRFLEVSAAHFDEYAGFKSVNRLVIDGGFRLPIIGSELAPFYAGIHYNTGGRSKTPDDLRLFLGFLFKINEIANIYSRYAAANP